MADNYYDDFDGSKIDKNLLKKQIIYKLYKSVKKDKGVNMPHYRVPKPGVVTSADLLFLPHDNGYKYALVVVDDASKHVDAEPLKSKKAEAVLRGFKKIFDRGIVKQPSSRMEVDSGKEFKGDVREYFKKNGVFVRYGKPGRSRQQALVERKNQMIGTIILKRLTSEELLTGKDATEWTHLLPKIVESINKRIGDWKPLKSTGKPLCEGDTCEILKEGTKVRAALDKPKEVTGKKLAGKFRSSDIRWDPKIRVIKAVIMKRDSPPLYLLDGNVGPRKLDPTPYTKNQLQVVDDGEENPPESILQRPPRRQAVLDDIVEELDEVPVERTRRGRTVKPTEKVRENQRKKN